MARHASTGSWIAALIVVLALVAAGVYLVRKSMHMEQPAASASHVMTPGAASTAPAPIRHPITEAQASPASASTAALPTLDQSDADVTSALERLAGDSSLRSLLVRPQIIARIVATIDAMPGRSLGGFMLPARTPKGAFVTQDVAGSTVIGERNAERYAPYMRIVGQVDPQALVSWYVHAYPLFQQAYRQLGYPNGHFNDRLVAVIDNLLAAPEPVTPPNLILANGHYVFADPQVESLSAGQRLLLRLGPADEATIKAKLRAIRGLLIGQPLHPASTATASPAGPIKPR